MKQKLIPYAKKIGIAFVITYLFFIAISSLAFQFYIKPNLNNYKSRIEILASEATGQTIKINSLEGRWDFINPEFALNEVVFYDSQNNTTLALQKISADFSWLSPFYLSPTLSEIKLKTPKLLIRRDMTNKIFIGGIPIDGPANNKLTNWLLNQKKVSIEQGEIDWLDEYKQAPVLTLKDLNFSYKTPFIIELIGQHKFDVNFRISNSDNQFVGLSGKIYAKKIEDINSWDSEVKIKAPMSSSNILVSIFLSFDFVGLSSNASGEERTSSSDCSSSSSSSSLSTVLHYCPPFYFIIILLYG